MMENEVKELLAKVGDAEILRRLVMDQDRSFGWYNADGPEE